MEASKHHNLPTRHHSNNRDPISEDRIPAAQRFL